MIGESFLIALVLLQGLNKVEIVEFDALIGVCSAEDRKLVVSQWNLVVVKDRTHTSEGHPADLGDVFILEERL